MSIVNRRNAVLGWLAWMLSKRVMRKKARSAVPAIEDGRPNTAAKVAAGTAAAGGVLLIWRRKRRGAGAGEDGADVGEEPAG